MKKLFSVTLLLLILSVASVSASADTFTLVSGSGVTHNGFTVGPLNGLLNGTSITTWCNDFDDFVNFGDTWEVNVLSFSSLSGGELTQYQQVAWLTTQFAVTDQSQWGDIHYALWRVFDDDPTLVNAGSDFWLALAQSQNFANFDFSSFRILRPTGDPGQEMITTVPEPITLLLFGTGLAGVAARVRRRRRVV
ncbi:MAG TPA: PEP-CTERM sorting domain-containing protein [Pyrinomonadaceae bacterium]|nr:PEP-CTERM sorting domain-containing protein [Pyrinomonadaceae bacterium]